MTLHSEQSNASHAAKDRASSEGVVHQGADVSSSAAKPREKLRFNVQMQDTFPKISDSEVSALAQKGNFDPNDIHLLVGVAVQSRKWNMYHTLVEKGACPNKSTRTVVSGLRDWGLRILETDPEHYPSNQVLALVAATGNTLAVCYTLSRQDTLQFSQVGMAVAAFSIAENPLTRKDAFWILDRMDLSPQHYALALGCMVYSLNGAMFKEDIAKGIHERAVRNGGPEGCLFESFARMPYANLVFAAGADGDPDRTLAVTYKEEDFEATKQMLELVDPAQATCNKALLQVAARYGKWGVVSKLVEMGVTLQSSKCIPIDEANAVFKSICDANNEHAPGNVVLASAAQFGSISALRFILGHPEAFNYSNEAFQYLPLLAASGGHDMAAKWLLLCNERMSPTDLVHALYMAAQRLVCSNNAWALYASAYSIALPFMAEITVLSLTSMICQLQIRQMQSPLPYMESAGVPKHIRGLALASCALATAYECHHRPFDDTLQTSLALSLAVIGGSNTEYIDDRPVAQIAALESADMATVAKHAGGMDWDNIRDRIPLMMGLRAAVCGGKKELAQYYFKDRSMESGYNANMAFMLLHEAIKEGSVCGVQIALDAIPLPLGNDYDWACALNVYTAVITNKSDCALAILNHDLAKQTQMAHRDEMLRIIARQGNGNTFKAMVDHVLQATGANKEAKAAVIDILIKYMDSTDAQKRFMHLLQTAKDLQLDVVPKTTKVLDRLAGMRNLEGVTALLNSAIVSDDQMRLIVLDEAVRLSQTNWASKVLELLLRTIGDVPLDDRMKWAPASNQWSLVLPEMTNSGLLSHYTAMCNAGRAREFGWILNGLRYKQIKRGERELVRTYLQRAKADAKVQKYRDMEAACAVFYDDVSDATMREQAISSCCSICREDLLIAAEADADIMKVAALDLTGQQDTHQEATPCTVQPDAGVACERGRDDELESEPRDKHSDYASISEGAALGTMWGERNALDPVVIKCPGRHLAHRECFFMWFQRRRVCPLCSHAFE